MEDHSSTQNQILKFDIDDFVPPHVTNGMVTGVFVRLSAASSAPGSYVTLSLTDTILLDIDFSASNDWTFIFKDHGIANQKAEKVVEAEHELTFNLGKTPANLKDSEGKFLDPDKLFDMQIILFYDGELKAPPKTR